MNPRHSAPAVLALLCVATAYVYRWVYNLTPLPAPYIDPYDTYAQFVPNILYAAESLRQGGGLLWNAYQSCGQPFFADVQTGILYPPHWLFLVLHHELALLVNTALHLSLAGIGAYALGREYGLARPAALAGALAFQLCGPTLELAVWSPTHIGPYAWIPWALLFAERALRQPGARTVVALAATIALQFLPGFPQTVFFTCQLVLLRAAWVLVLDRKGRPLAAAGAVAAGILVSVLLAAVQLVPSWELSQLSTRSGDLSNAQIGLGIHWSAKSGRLLFADGVLPSLAPAWFALFLVALLHPRRASLARFLLVAATLYVGLAFGPGTPLFELYAALPMGRIFRDPTRFLWISGFALSILVGIGVDSLFANQRDRARPVPALTWLLLLAPLAALRWYAPLPVSNVDLAALTALLVVAGLALVRRRQKEPGWLPAPVAAWPLPVLLGIAAYLSAEAPSQRPNPSIDLWKYERSLELVQERRTSQDRVFFAGKKFDFALSPKVASVYRLPSPYDYQHQAPARYAEFFVKASTDFGPTRTLGAHLRDELADDLTRWVTLADPRWFQWGVLRRFNRRLFDMTATRYLVIDKERDATSAVFQSGAPLRLLQDSQGVRVYENPSAFPRAFIATRVLLESAEDLALYHLANPGFDARERIVLSASPGEPTPELDPFALGSVVFLQDDPEEVRIQATTTGPAVLFLADQYFPGWSATVNGSPARLWRANYAFRAVEIPEGASEVRFRYAPASVRTGAWISLVTFILAMGTWFVSRRRAATRG